LPFEVKVDDPNETTYEAIESTKNNEDIYGPFDMVKYLVSALDT
jgi:addiction module antitoxin, relB/dinJ family